MRSFDHFVAIDWSGARALPSYRHKLQIAVCDRGTCAPRLLTPRAGFSRSGVADMLASDWLGTSALIGFDFSFAPPFVDRGTFLPDSSAPATARGLWAFVDSACTDADFGAASFIDTHFAAHFYHGLADGPKADRMRLRVCEQAFNASGGGKPSSIFDAVGAAQVAKASFAGMRVLAQIGARTPVWPFDPKPARGAVIVEIYCRAFIRHAGLRGLKIRDLDSLNSALAALDSEPLAAADVPALTDDMTDALISAAGLRKLHADAAFWAPAGLTAAIAVTEGWTFGVR